MRVAPVSICRCCGSRDFAFTPILWPALIAGWRLSGFEVDYVNRQQGLHCARCRTNLRAMALATALMRCFGYDGLFKDFVRLRRMRRLRVLEINEADKLTAFLSRLPGHLLQSYPDIDMMDLSFADNSFDVVIHSDTLEHIEHPVRALSECARVLKRGGLCAFTVPMIVDRPTLSRKSLPLSYHGHQGTDQADLVVHTEYGPDVWKQVIQAGFSECRIVSLEYPSAQALVGVKSASGQGRARGARRWPFR